VIASFIALTRERVGECIRSSSFPPDVLEAVCVCKFVGTSFSVDVVSGLRKSLGSHALLEDSRLGARSFVCNATCAAEGDNTIMEQKIVRDLVKDSLFGLIPRSDLLWRCLGRPVTRRVLLHYLQLVCRLIWAGKAVIYEGQLIR
jgi:hypothetical protein